ncbi:MAG: type II secretion system protein [Planctomycetes bacterium]|nr:type II secretion system protein [Planctomycetota bacterium]
MRRIQHPGFTLIELLVVIAIIGVLAAMLLPALAAARKQSKKVDCKNNLKQLGTNLIVYTSRYGSNDEYPITGIPPGGIGSGAPIVPGNPNNIFWAWVYRVPSQTDAVMQRPGDDAVFVCRVTGTQPTTSALEYTAPSLMGNWPAGFGPPVGSAIYPNRVLSESVRADVPIAGDIVNGNLPNFPNHGGTAGTPGFPNDDWNGLFADGHVESIVPGGARHTLYNTSTTGIRST